MHDLRNLTNSPYAIMMTEGGSKVLPASGELKGVEVHPMYVQQIKNCGYIEILESGKPSDPDGGDLGELRERYESLTGEAPDRRWSKRRLLSEIGKARSDG